MRWHHLLLVTVLLGLVGAPQFARLAPSKEHGVSDRPGVTPSARKRQQASGAARVRSEAITHADGLEQTRTFSHRAHAHPHGHQVCASSCVLSHHPTPALSRTRFRRLLQALAAQPADRPSRPFDTLLFYGPQSDALLQASPPSGLPRDHRVALEQELSRTAALVSIRIVDRADRIVAYLPETSVPFDTRHEFALDSQWLGAVTASGTVKRVGCRRLWTRL